jgi:hypothetical protein
VHLALQVAKEIAIMKKLTHPGLVHDISAVMYLAVLI